MNTNELFHLWAHQAKPAGKSGNVRFDGVDLYSYGACIATMVNGVVVLSDRSYSMTYWDGQQLPELQKPGTRSTHGIS